MVCRAMFARSRGDMGPVRTGGGEAALSTFFVSNGKFARIEGCDASSGRALGEEGSTRGDISATTLLVPPESSATERTAREVER
mmetsp:Transcript_12127/g.38770  ORF Transcript_12127/g.38770 Transcript_12127/m.38770 type:complete len:84 (+) Transcript_12127:1761-2012(+)